MKTCSSKGGVAEVGGGAYAPPGNRPNGWETGFNPSQSGREGRGLLEGFELRASSLIPHWVSGSHRSANEEQMRWAVDFSLLAIENFLT